MFPLSEKVLLDDTLTGEDKFILTLVYSGFPLDSEKLRVILNRSEKRISTIMGKLTNKKLVQSKQEQNGRWTYSKPEQKQRKLIRRKSKKSHGMLDSLRSNESIYYNNIDLRSKSMDSKRKFVPDKVFPFLEYWSLQDLRIAGETTNQFSKDIESLKHLLSGRVFAHKSVPYKYMERSFTFDEWKIAVDRFKLAAFDEHYYPVRKDNLRKYTISDFIYNPYALRKNGVGTPSFFLNMLESAPKRLREIQDDCPEITARFKFLFNEYRKEVHNDYGYKPSTEDNERFAKATKRTVKFFEDLKTKTESYHVEFSRANSVPDFVWAAVLHDMSGSGVEISPGYLCSNITFERRIPNYLMYKRIL